MPRAKHSSRKAPSTRDALVRIGGLVLILVAVALIGHALGWFDVRHVLAHVARLRRSFNAVDFSIAFVGAVGLGSALGAPGLPFIVAAGALFGTLFGSVLGWAGEMVGAVAGYWLARTIGRGVVTSWLGRFKRARGAVAAARDFDGMLRLRLLPVLPLGIVNFVGGLARAPFLSYLAATSIGIIPSTLIYAYFADALLEGVGSGRSDALLSLVIASALLVTLTLAPRWLSRTTD